jgi:DNA-binding response OmpR family regulator
MKKRVLVVEDDAALARVLRDNLEFEGFEVAWVGDGQQAVTMARSLAPDLVLLDVMLPGRDGFDLCGLLRQGGATPIIMLTARGQKADKLRGLQLGADDYVTKPFDIEELMARVHAVLRRSSPVVECVTLGDVTVDFRQMTVRQGCDDLHMTHREFELLRYLVERQGRVVSRHELLREIWGFPDAPTTRSVDHAIARLRKKIEPDPGRPRYIHTVFGDGYTITPEGRPAGPSDPSSGPPATP